jgi:hypothetical protein
VWTELGKIREELVELINGIHYALSLFRNDLVASNRIANPRAAAIRDQLHEPFDGLDASIHHRLVRKAQTVWDVIRIELGTGLAVSRANVSIHQWMANFKLLVLIQCIRRARRQHHLIVTKKQMC